jgi:hypothetical protein
LILLLIEKPCLLKFHKINCSLNQARAFHSDLTKFISQFESGFTCQKKLKLGKIHFDLKLVESDSLPTKNELSGLVSTFHQKEAHLEENLNFLPFFKPFKEIESSSFFKDTSEDLEFKEFFPDFRRSNLQDFNTFDMILMKFQKKQEMILQKIEWEKQEIMKEKILVEAKKKKLIIKKLKLQELSEKLKKEKLDIYKEKEEFESLKSSTSLISTTPSSENSSLHSDFSPKPQSSKLPFSRSPKPHPKFSLPSLIPDLQSLTEKVLSSLDVLNPSEIRSHLFQIREKLAIFTSNSIHSNLNPVHSSYNFPLPSPSSLPHSSQCPSPRSSYPTKAYPKSLNPNISLILQSPKPKFFH